MIALSMTEVKECMSKLLLSETFDSFLFIISGIKIFLSLKDAVSQYFNKNFNYIQNSLLSIDAMKIQNAKMYSKNLNMNMKQSNNSFYYNNMFMQMGQNLPQMMMNQNGNMVHY